MLCDGEKRGEQEERDPPLKKKHVCCNLGGLITMSQHGRTGQDRTGAKVLGGGKSLEPLFRVKVGLDVRHALAGDRVDGMQWHESILLVKHLHLIEVRRNGPRRGIENRSRRRLDIIRLLPCCCCCCGSSGGSRTCAPRNRSRELPLVLCAAQARQHVTCVVRVRRPRFEQTCQHFWTDERDPSSFGGDSFLRTCQACRANHRVCYDLDNSTWYTVSNLRDCTGFAGVLVISPL